MEQQQISLNQVYAVLLELKAKMQKIDQYMEDLEFARRVAEAWERHDQGKFKSLPADKFLEQLKKW